MIRACIFDLDGTLLDTLHALKETISLTMEHLGYRAIDEEHTKIFVGEGYQKFIQNALIYSGDTECTHQEEAEKFYLETFEKTCLDGVKPYDGVVEALKKLKEKGILLGVLSNKSQDRAEDNIYSQFGKALFDLVYGEREGIPKKPDPTALLAMLKELNVCPEECMYFGDTSTDMQTGRAAKVHTVGVLWGFRDRNELESFSPEKLLSHPSEIGE